MNSRFRCSRISRTPTSFAQSNSLMCLSASRTHRIRQCRCRIRPYSSASKMSRWRGNCLDSYLVAPSHQSIQDRDHPVAIIDTQISTSLKDQPFLEPRFDPRQLHPQNSRSRRQLRDWYVVAISSVLSPHTSCNFFSQLHTSVRIPDNEHDNSPSKSRHTTCSSVGSSLATSLER